jgi:hypothetical protein
MRRQVGLALREQHYASLRAMADAANITPPEMAEAIVVGAIEGARRVVVEGGGRLRRRIGPG